MKRTVCQLLVLFVLALPLYVPGCASVVGDDCAADSDCGTGLVCERSLPGGYCTVEDCLIDGCPDEGVCIEFDTFTSFCMDPCQGAGDCREGYVCVDDFGAHPFCNAVDAPTE